jgi:hypothetical protein
MARLLSSPRHDRANRARLQEAPALELTCRDPKFLILKSVVTGSLEQS